MNELDTGFNFRSDGRSPDQARELEFSLGVSGFQQFDGSALVEQGFSRLVVFVEGPKSVY
jgi:exosome complex RNA-binding protein Rrp42 (RNase PH superfamily)